MEKPCIRQILTHVKEFRKFWKEKGPFPYALTSNEFPPILLEQEEWLFGDDIQGLLKELMQFDQQKMDFVPAPFNLEKKNRLRPQGLIPWKIHHFPEQWNDFPSDFFVPQGHLTGQVMEEARALRQVQGSDKFQKEPDTNPQELLDEKFQVEKGFFSLLEKNLEKMGYVLLKPVGNSTVAFIKAYLLEWEQDEKEAGLL